ncbi:MAG: hypothetical protein OEX81_01635 [Candidatus Pacebacteria bacterium]|nr:hypothetical protein [Candidatus Paceibacterota bacterium]
MSENDKSAVVVTNNERFFNEIDLMLRREGFKSIIWQTTMPDRLPENTDLLVSVTHSFTGSARHLFQTLRAEKKIAVFTGIERDEITEKLGHHVIYKTEDKIRSLVLPL